MLAVVIAILVVVIAYEFYRIPVPKESTDTFMIKLVLAAVKISTIKVFIEVIIDLIKKNHWYFEIFPDSYIVFSCSCTEFVGPENGYLCLCLVYLL